ncbi:ATP-dependent DNA helicase RecQ [Chryseobacterium sp. MP_3.2]|nr:ATP-dependent DNA helicase RecQ [Chryseobacterium sp. MP_3.2]
MQTLSHFWGYDAFKDSQEEIIDAVISGKDTLALLPTGGGKSMCYQLPALILEGTCLVISPLLALMKDQVFQLKNNGIEAEYLSSELDEYEAEIIFNRCKSGLTKLLYLSPERLTNRLFLQHLEEIQVSFIAVDEAHCISEWGQDFRPSYQNIKQFRENLKKIPVLALTATATPKVLQEIQLKLNLRGTSIFQKSFRRTNIKIISDQVSDKYERILNLMKFNNSSGIIYVRSRKETEELTHFLRKNDIKNVDYFHAGLPVKEKNEKQNYWIKSHNHVLVSTNAFGMGIDKDQVRFVAHFSPPQSLENYYQEIGRAGRDGLESFAFLLWNDQELRNFDEILYRQIPNKAEFQNMVTYLYSCFQIAENDLPENIFQLHVSRIQNYTKYTFAKINNVLNFLHHQEIIFMNTYQSLSTIEMKIKPDELDLLAKKDAYFMELLFRNVSGLNTHKQKLSELNFSKKIGSEIHVVKERIREMQQKKYLEYIDGNMSSIKFLKHRDDRAIGGQYWNLFEQIQKNKIQKWEEMKFFVQNTDFCKMKMILSYFGEKNVKNCGKCSVCDQQKEQVFGRNIGTEIIQILQQKPSSVEEISMRLNYFEKENILENLIHLLDSGKVKMLNFRTYTLA